MFYIYLAPKEVARPEIDKIEKGNIKFRLTPASEENGGISHYFLIVVPILNNTLLRRPQDYQFNEVKLNIYKENKSYPFLTEHPDFTNKRYHTI